MEHQVSLNLLLFDFFSELHLLLTFFFHFFFGSIEKLLIEILLLLDILFAQLLTEFYLLIKNITHLSGFLNVLSLLLFDLLFVELLAEFLNLTPLVVANVRRQIFNLHSVDSIR